MLLSIRGFLYGTFCGQRKFSSNAIYPFLHFRKKVALAKWMIGNLSENVEKLTKLSPFCLVAFPLYVLISMAVYLCFFCSFRLLLFLFNASSSFKA